jgi:hypothetical protein
MFRPFLFLLQPEDDDDYDDDDNNNNNNGENGALGSHDREQQSSIGATFYTINPTRTGTVHGMCCNA